MSEDKPTFKFFYDGCEYQILRVKEESNDAQYICHAKNYKSAEYVIGLLSEKKNEQI